MIVAKAFVIVTILILAPFLYLELKPQEKWMPVQGQCIQNLQTKAIFKVKSLSRRNFSQVVYAEAIAIPGPHSSEENIDSVIAKEDLGHYRKAPCP